MIRLADHWYQPVTETISGLKIGATNLSSQALVKDDEGAVVDGRALRDAAHDYRQRVRGTYAPQLAALMFFATSRPAAMRGYFPLLRALEPAAIDDFEARTTAAARQLDLRLFDENQRGAVREVDLPRDAAYLVAGQIVEVFYFRQDILERLLAARTRIWLYATGAAYQAHGGVGGGCYSPGIGGIQLVLARLYEGFTGSMPGVAPLLHELGHLFDCFDVRRATQGAATGLYPGLRHEDGSLFTPDARAYFLRGKRLERCSYQTSWIIPLHPSGRMGIHFYTNTSCITAPMPLRQPAMPRPYVDGGLLVATSPRLSQHQAAPTGGGSPAARTLSSASSSARPPSLGCAADTAGAGACRRAHVAAPAAPGATREGARNDNTPATIPGGATAAARPASSTRCGGCGPPRFAEPSG